MRKNKNVTAEDIISDANQFCDCSIEEIRERVLMLETKINKEVSKGKVRSSVLLDKRDADQKELESNLKPFFMKTRMSAYGTLGANFTDTPEWNSFRKQFIDIIFNDLGISKYANYLDSVFGDCKNACFNWVENELKAKILELKKQQEDEDFVKPFNALNGLREKKDFVKEVVSCNSLRKELRNVLFPNITLPEIEYGDGVDSFVEAIKECSDEDKILFCYMISLEAAAYVEEHTKEYHPYNGLTYLGEDYVPMSDKSIEERLWQGYLACKVAKQISEKAGIKYESTALRSECTYNKDYSYNTNMSILLCRYLSGEEGVFTELKVFNKYVPIYGRDLITANFWQKIQPSDAYDLMVAREEAQKKEQTLGKTTSGQYN